jgi:hypothetical protein
MQKVVSLKEARTDSHGARIRCVGCGSLGSQTVLFLRNEEAEMTVIDHDRVSSANTKSQMHSRQSVGKNKAVSLRDSFRFLFNLDLRAIPSQLTDDNVSAVLEHSDLVIDAVDNAKTRRLIQAFCTARSISCLHGGLAAADQRFGMVGWDEDFPIDEDDGVQLPTCEDGAALPFIARVAAEMADMANQWLRHGKRLKLRYVR